MMTLERQSKKPHRARLQVPRDEAERRLQVQIDKGKELINARIASEEDLRQTCRKEQKWSDYNEELLRQIVKSDELASDYHSRRRSIGFGPLSVEEGIKVFRLRVEGLVTHLESIRDRLELIPEVSGLAHSMAPPQPSHTELSNKVFVVHGHDEGAKQAVARCIEKLGLKAIILHEQPNRGRTIIEKFEDYSDVGFSVVLLTPDDIGTAKNDRDNLRPRARQNVILELGFFAGKLGRDRVCALHKGEVEIPSDFAGVLWIHMDVAGAWRLALAKEMKAAGLDVDLNRLV